MEKFEEIEQELNEVEGELEGLSQSFQGNRAKDLVRLVVPTGKLKGELTGLTRKQYRDMIGTEPSPRLLWKLEGQTTKKIPWDLALDVLASERGFNSDEDLRDAIIAAKEDKQEIDRLTSRSKALIADIQASVTEGLFDVRKFKLERQGVLPGIVIKSEKTEVNGAEVEAYRQHSYWTIEVDLDDDGVVDHKFEIRYAKEARELVDLAVKDIKKREQRKREELHPVKKTRKRTKKVLKKKTGVTDMGLGVAEVTVGKPIVISKGKPRIDSKRPRIK